MPFRLSRRTLLNAAAGIAAYNISRPRHATARGNWPDRPIRLVVPFTPGGSNDALARPLADALQARLGQPVVVENRPGAAGSIGAAFVANAPPDGYTLLLASSSFATSSTFRRTPFDALESFDAIAQICLAPMVVVTKPEGGFRDMAELVRHARAHPNTLQYGMAGMGGIGHFSMEAFNMAAEVKMDAIPYAGIAPTQTDLLSGRIDFLMTTLASVRGLVDAGTVPVIAVSSAERMENMPDVPTIREATGIDFAVDIWWGILGPRGIPPAIRQRLNEEINTIIAMDSYKQFLSVEGANPAPASVDGFAQALRVDILRWRQLAAAANLHEDN